MNFTVTGADKKSGEDIEITLTAASQAEAERLASRRGVLVASVKAETDGTGELDPIELWGEEKASAAAVHTAATGASPAPEQSASQPSTAAAAAAASHHLASSRYHVIQNPALYLLELAVNKQLRDGWEPLGGIQVSMVNNQLLFYQALTRPRQNSDQAPQS